jgi:hypothetical protein
MQTKLTPENNFILLQDRAHTAVWRAVMAGRLPNLRRDPTPCVDCGAPSVVYDHRDYGRPLEVEPVCRRCNRLRGPAVGHDLGRANQQRQERRLRRLEAVDWLT